MKLSFSKLLICVFPVFIAGGCGDSSSSQPEEAEVEPKDSHQRMLFHLRKVHDRTADDNLFLGDRELREAQTRMANLSASESPETKLQRLDLIWSIGFHQLRLGQTADAIDQFDMAYRQLKSADHDVPPKFARQVVFQLAVAYLRRGETENCIHCQTGESCTLPIRAGGIHQRRSGSTNAIKVLTELLEYEPDDLPARWLLNVAHMTLGSYPDDVPKQFLIEPKRFTSAEAFPRFANVATQVGLDTLSLAGGTVIDDFDNDGYLDILVSSWHSTGQLRHFHNDGNGSFSDRTKESGLTGLFGGLNMVQADYDNDGDIDVYVLRGAWLGAAGAHPNSLLQNDGQGHFRDVTFDVGLGESHHPTQTAAWADFNNDGHVDLLVGNEHAPFQLFKNQGNGKFVDVAQQAGLPKGLFTKGVVWGDIDNDRYPDLYVSNLGQANALYHNNGDGTFTNVAKEAGVEKPHESFPVWFWDFNNDGALDLYVSAYWCKDASYFTADFLGLPHEAETDRLYQGDGNGKFVDVSKAQNVDHVTLPMGSNFGDLDNDGFPDFYLGTGYIAYDGIVPNRMFRNLGDGKGFVDVTMAGGFGHLQKGHGVAFADLDNDGDQDVFAELGGAFLGDRFRNALFENPGFKNHSIAIKLVGKNSNRSGIGARIRLEVEEAGKTRSIYKWVNSGGSFGANSLCQQIGVGKATTIKVLEVYWPTSDQTQEFKDVAVDQSIEITECASKFQQRDWKSVRFKKVPKTAKR